jgi:hypothetical protein
VSSYSYNQLRAGYAADAGLKYALRRLADVSQWTPGFSNAGQAPGDDVARATLDAKEGLYFSVLVSDWRSSPNNPPTIDGYTLKPGEAYVRTMGECQMQSSRGAKTFRISKAYLVSPGLPDFQYGIVADQSLEVLDGSVIDGYTTQTRNGNPPPYPMWVGQYSPLPQWNQLIDNGHTICNANGQKVLVRNSSIRGKLHLGQGGTPQIQGNCWLQPAVQTGRADVPFHRPPFSPSRVPFETFTPAYSCPVPPSGDIVVPPDSLWAIVPGCYRSLTIGARARVYLDLEQQGLNQYYFTDHVTINGGTLNLARFNHDESAQIYIGKKLECTDGWNNPEGRPSQVNVMFVGEGQSKSQSQMLISGTSQTWIVASGGGLDVQIAGQSHLFGGIKCKKAKIANGAQVHYDVALRGGGLQGLIEWRYKQVAAVCPSIEMALAIQSPSPPPSNILPSNATAVGPAPAITIPSFVQGPQVTPGSPAAPYTPPLGPFVITTIGVRRLDPQYDPNIFQGVPPGGMNFIPPLPPAVTTPPGTTLIPNDPFAPLPPAPGGGTTSGGTTTGGTTSGGTTTGGTTSGGTTTGGTTSGGTTTGGTTSGGTTTGGTTTGGTTTGGTTTGGTTGGGYGSPIDQDPNGVPLI